LNEVAKGRKDCDCDAELEEVVVADEGDDDDGDAEGARKDWPGSRKEWLLGGLEEGRSISEVWTCQVVDW
jgi:hypothetical protein